MELADMRGQIEKHYQEYRERLQQDTIERSLMVERTKRALEEATKERVAREHMAINKQRFFWNDEKVR